MGLRRGAELLRDAGDALGAGALPFSQLIPGGFIRYMSTADNARYRALIARALPNELVLASSPQIEAAAGPRSRAWKPPIREVPAFRRRRICATSPTR